MKDNCSISDFYLVLKLGIFNSMRVENKGCFSLSETNNTFLRKPLSSYLNQDYAKKQLSIGLYLMDSFLLTKNNRTATHILVIAVCRTSLAKKKNIYVVKLSETPATNDIITLLNESLSFSSSRKRKSVFRRRSKQSHFDYSPLNSTPRKH